MGDAYPDLVRAQPAIESAFQQEEQNFQRTLGRGLALLDEETASLGKGGVLKGDVAFKLYDTYGFPLDLTQDVLRGREMRSIEGWLQRRDGQAARRQPRQLEIREAGDGSGEIWFAVRDASGATSFQGYDSEETVVKGTSRGTHSSKRRAGEGAQGGRQGRTRVQPDAILCESPAARPATRARSSSPAARRFRVDDVQKRASDVFAHVGEMLSGGAKVGDVAN